MRLPAPGLAAVALVLGCTSSQLASRPISIVRPGCAGSFSSQVAPDGRRAHDELTFDDIFEETVVFSADGRHDAYVARAGEQWFVVHDQKTSVAWEGVGFLRYGAVGPVYAGLRAGQWCVVRGEAEDRCFASILEDSVTLAGKTVAYVGVAADGLETLVVNGASAGSGASLSLVRLSEDGLHAGCVGRAVAGEGNVGLRVDGALVGTAHRIPDWSPAGGGTWVAVRDGVYTVETRTSKLGPYRFVSPLVTLGSHVAFFAGVAGGEVIVFDGVATRPFEGVVPGSVVISPTGTDFAAVVRVRPVGRPDEPMGVNVATSKHLFDPADGATPLPAATGRPASDCTQLVFSSDGKVLGAVAVSEEAGHTITLTAVDSGKLLWDARDLDDVSDLFLSPDGARVIALTRANAGFSVLQHCLNCASAPKLSWVGQAMPGTLVADPEARAWAVLTGRPARDDERQSRLAIAGSWVTWEDSSLASYDPGAFGTDVVRLDRLGAANPIIEAWRLQAKAQLDLRFGCLGMAYGDTVSAKGEVGAAGR